MQSFAKMELKENLEPGKPKKWQGKVQKLALPR
jgi:hypothetical protein